MKRHTAEEVIAKLRQAEADLFDAGAGKRDAGVRALWDLVAAEHPRLDVTLRACRYPHRLRRWKELPSGLFLAEAEPGPYTGAPAKEIRLAKTETVLRGESAEQAVRTVICREVVPWPKKDRWHPLFTTTAVTPLDVLTMFRARQHHEQAYRVGVYDEALDAVPCGYDKESPNPKRPRFHRGPLQLVGWLVALVYNAVADLAGELAGDWEGCHVRTIRRTFLNRPGMVYGTPTAVVVVVVVPFVRHADSNSALGVARGGVIACGVPDRSAIRKVCAWR